MDVRQLQYFIAAAKAESFSKAADRMHVSQSALGSQIRNLEQELGGDLFERHSRGTELTPSGKVLLTYAEEIIEKIQLAKDAMATSREARDCNVVVGMTSTVSCILAAPLLYRISEKHPEIRLTVVEEKSDALIEKVATRDITLALGFNSHHVDGVRWEPVLEEHLYFVENAAFGKQNGGEITLAEVTRHRLALPSIPAVVRSVIEAEAAAQKLTLNVPYNVNSNSLIRTLVAQRAAASIMPIAAVRDQVEAGEFIAKRITPPVHRELYFMSSELQRPGRGATIIKRELQLLMKIEEKQGTTGWQPLQDREGAANRAYVAGAATSLRGPDPTSYRALATV